MIGTAEKGEESRNVNRKAEVTYKRGVIDTFSPGIEK